MPTTRRSLGAWLGSGLRPRCRLREREGKEHCRTGARLTFHPDAAAVGLDDAARDGETHTEAFPALGPRLPEPVEDMRQMLGRDADARIVDGDEDTFARPPYVDSYPATGLGELEGIADQVREHLAETLPIRGYGRQRPLQFGRELQRAAARDRREHVDHFLYHVLDADVAELQCDSPSLELLHIEQVVDEPLHLLRGLPDEVQVLPAAGLLLLPR